MSLKKTTRILPAEMVDMGGFPVKQALPTNQVSQIDPFLLLHHARVKPIYDRPAKDQGVGPHPHRGFSPVTFVIEGEVHHRDSRGNSQIAKAGEVQWINSGAGIIHSERPSDDLIANKGMQEIIQLWINTPADKKMLEPEYTHVPENKIPRIKSEDDLTDLKLISGSYKGSEGKIKAQSDLLILWANAKSNAALEIEIPEGYNSTLYAIKGDLRIEGHGVVDAESLAVFGNEGNTIVIHANSDSQYIVLAGLPINEPMTQHGPFVMNTQTEIMEAMRDYQMGKMGVLIEE